MTETCSDDCIHPAHGDCPGVSWRRYSGAIVTWLAFAVLAITITYIAAAAAYPEQVWP